MRACVVVLFLGGFAMTTMQEATSQEKKDEPKKVPLESPFTEYVTVRPWDKQGKKFNNPHKGLPAYLAEVPKGTPGIVLQHGNDLNPGSEIEQADGTIWIIIKAHRGDGEWRIEATKKTPAKK